MTDDYSKIERARLLLPIDETNERYFTLLFVALRLVGCSLKEAIKVVNSEAQGAEISYKHLYKELSALASIVQESGDTKMGIIPEDGVKRAAEETRAPKGNLGHMIWIEAIIRTPKSKSAFIKELRKVRTEIVNPAGG